MREILNINSGWAFSREAQQVPGEFPGEWEQVNLPHCWNNIDGMDGGGDYHRGLCYYVRKITREELPQGEKIFLEINGANSSADVYVNGKHLCHHDGGYSTWRVELTQELGQEALLAIGVDNSPNNTVYPQVADFTFYGGLYRNVNLIGVSEKHMLLWKTAPPASM